jgi:general secretion pathway protein J
MNSPGQSAPDGIMTTGRPALPLAKQVAFTLIELLIALAIFAILSVIAYRTLGSVFQTREQLTVESSKWRDLALFFARTENDLAALVNRPIRNVDDRLAAAFCLSAFAPGPNDAQLAFTRLGFVDANGIASAPQRIGYRGDEAGAKIDLLLWTGLDQAPRAIPQVYAALNHVRSVKWRVLDRGGNWREDWPPAPASCNNIDKSLPPYPLALQMDIVLASGESVTRLFNLRSVTATP